MTMSSVAEAFPPGQHSAEEKGGFCWYRDEQLTQSTPYHCENNYFQKARDRMDRTVGLIQHALQGSTIVDIGASPFYLLYRALQLGAKRACGIYFANDDHPLRVMKTIHAPVGSVELIHSNIERDCLPLADDSVDVLTACEVLEHLECFPFCFVEEVRRVLRPGGIVCFTVPNAASIGNILKLIFQKNIFMKYRSDPTGRHKHEFTLAELKAFVSYLGCDIVKAGVLPSPTSEKMWLRPIYRLIAKIPGIWRYSPVLFVVGRQQIKKPRDFAGAPPAILYSDDLSIEA
jgi:SAM-dependent methyltransferase